MSSSVRGTEAFVLSSLPFFLRSLCFYFNAVRAAISNSAFLIVR